MAASDRPISAATSLIRASRYPSRVKTRTAAAISSGSRSCASRLPVMPRMICVSKWLTYTTKRNRQETLSSAEAPSVPEVAPVGEHPAAQADGAPDVQDATGLVTEAVDARSQRQACSARDWRDDGVHHPSPLHPGDRRQGLEAAAGRVPSPFGIKGLLRPAAATMCVVPGKALL